MSAGGVRLARKCRLRHIRYNGRPLGREDEVVGGGPQMTVMTVAEMGQTAIAQPLNRRRPASQQHPSEMLLIGLQRSAGNRAVARELSGGVVPLTVR